VLLRRTWVEEGNAPMKKSLFAGLAIVSFTLSACGGGGEEKAAEATASTEAAKVAAEGGELAKAAAGATGVAECDEYLTKVMACVEDKIPEAQRAMIKKSIDDSKAQWAAVPDKAALATQCKTAMDQAKQSFGAMGCTF
jgi:hypothetical protein